MQSTCRCLLGWVLLAIFAGHRVEAEQQRLFIASPADPPAIFSCSLDIATGAFGKLQVAADKVEVEFLALHPRLPILYAATRETEKGQNPTPGGVRAYSIDKQTGTLKLFSQALTRDIGTTHLAVNPQGTGVGVCAYSGRGSCIISLEADGSLGDRVAAYVHEGSSVNASRQEAPHPHGVAFHASGDVLCVADLGNDHVEVLHWKSPTSLERASFWAAKPGAGPRHVSFHQNAKWLYAINELDNTLAVFEYDSQQRKLRELAVVPTLPADFQGENTTSEVVVHPNGKFLYGANRGHDSTVVFGIDATTGSLHVIEHEPTHGEHPRFVGLDPTGRVYLAANLISGNVVSFHIDQQSGKLAPTGHTLQVAQPMCIAFVR